MRAECGREEVHSFVILRAAIHLPNLARIWWARWLGTGHTGFEEAARFALDAGVPADAGLRLKEDPATLGVGTAKRCTLQRCLRSGRLDQIMRGRAIVFAEQLWGTLVEVSMPRCTVL